MLTISKNNNNLLHNKELHLLIDIVMKANDNKIDEAVGDLIMFGIYDISKDDIKYIYENFIKRQKYIHKKSSIEVKRKNKEKAFDAKIIKCYVLRTRKE